MKYTCNLINNEYCLFDSEEFNNKKILKSWAKNRGKNYTVIIVDNKNNEIIQEYKGR